MGHSQEDKAQSRERILDSAVSRIGQCGISGVAIGDVMKDAGLTKGAFYVHFESRDALIAEAARHAFRNGQEKIDVLFAKGRTPSIENVLDAWLNWEHIEHPAHGCGLCMLAGEARFAEPEVRQALAEQFRHNAAQIASTIGQGKQAKALATSILASLIGAISASRAVEDRALAREILAQTRAAILKLVAVGI